MSLSVDSEIFCGTRYLAQSSTRLQWINAYIAGSLVICSD